MLYKNVINIFKILIFQVDLLIELGQVKEILLSEKKKESLWNWAAHMKLTAIMFGFTGTNSIQIVKH